MTTDEKMETHEFDLNWLKLLNKSIGYCTYKEICIVKQYLEKNLKEVLK